MNVEVSTYDHGASIRRQLLKKPFIRTYIKTVKAEHLYSALHGIQTTLKRSDMDHTVLPVTNTMPALPRKRSPEGATD